MTIDVEKYVRYSYSATGINGETNEIKQKITLSEDSVLTEQADPTTPALGYFYTNSTTGFKGGIFKDTETDTTLNIVIGFAASSDDNPQSGVANFEILLSMIPRQFYYAYNLYLETLDYYTSLYPTKMINISFCGWSLGGALAELMGCVTGLQTYTFGSPGMSEYLSNPILRSQLQYYADDLGRTILPDPSSYTNIENYTLLNDPISTHNAHIGVTYTQQPVELDSNIINNVHRNVWEIYKNDINFFELPENWCFEYSVAILKYDKNYEQSQEAMTLLLSLSTMVSVQEDKLKEAINILNNIRENITHKLHYHTDFTDYIIGTDNDETGENTLTGFENNSNNCFIWGNIGNDQIQGLSGNDILIGDSTTLTIAELEKLQEGKKEVNIVYFESENDGNDYLNGGKVCRLGFNPTETFKTNKP